MRLAAECRTVIGSQGRAKRTMERIRRSHGANRGSNPLRDANKIKGLIGCAGQSVQHLAIIQEQTSSDSVGRE
jgi:hypothetical protein